MYMLHGTWIPEQSHEFDNPGEFCLWVETDQKPRGGKRSSKHPKPGLHPLHVPENALMAFFSEEFPIGKPLQATLRGTTCYFMLPSWGDAPLPSLEMSRYIGDELPDAFTWEQWQVACVRADNPLKFLKEIHFLALQYSREIQLGSDLAFWYHYTRAFREILLKDQYIPALKFHRGAPQAPKQKRGGRSSSRAASRQAEQALAIYPAWHILSPRYESMIAEYSRIMPLCCTAGSAVPAEPDLFEPESLLRHFSEYALEALVMGTPFTQKLQKQVQGSFIEHCLSPGVPARRSDQRQAITQQTGEAWQSWTQGLVERHGDTGFSLGLRLQSVPEDEPDSWALDLLAESKKDPSFKVELAHYWGAGTRERREFLRFFGQDFEKSLLVSLGQAARIYPKLWDGLETDRPAKVSLNIDEAMAFLKDSAWVLEDAGYKVAVPAWWTPKGRQRAKIRIKASATSVPSQEIGTGYFTLPSLTEYQYELAIGGQTVSEEEWQALVNAKTPLVRFRGEWMELDRDKMAKMLEFWRDQSEASLQMPMLDMIKQATEAQAGEDYEFEYDPSLADMVGRLRDKNRLTLMDNPAGLRGVLREYQKRGLSWLRYLEGLRMGPCLADDMGLGKTIQVIALLVSERDTRPPDAPALGPTLLVAPTSVIGNWQKEIERFAPQLKTLIHHGTERGKDAQAFKREAVKHDAVITSFALARKDAPLLHGIHWHRVVVDEAQNIKNPKSAQTRAIIKLEAEHRLAMTGTPIENRLLDLWSIFRFLNPSYLGTAAQFKKGFETPIQKESDPARSALLKELVAPFILRRMKTDKAIIKDLPDKIEQKIYCNLTQEQASLYQAVVKEVQEALEDAEGIQRKGLILSTLMRLKQICNHPAQFLQDGSAFSEERSHKLARVAEMIEEVIAEEESLLVFTQFTEIGAALERHLRSQYHYATYYLHGGVARGRRQKMIDEFQDPDTGPSAFILSLKAGGVGITLTKANHVFHFDRWWNPAVENQATDRAFRIGQQKKVFVHKLVALGTLEERIDQMLEDKQRLSDTVVGADESWLTELDNKAFRRLIELNRNAVL